MNKRTEGQIIESILLGEVYHFIFMKLKSQSLLLTNEWCIVVNWFIRLLYILILTGHIIYKIQQQLENALNHHKTNISPTSFYVDVLVLTMLGLPLSYSLSENEMNH